MSIFGIFFSTVMLASIGTGMVAGAFAFQSHDGLLGFMAGCLFMLPLAFLLGSGSGKEIARRSTQSRSSRS